MGREAKILKQIRQVGSEANVRFEDACYLLTRLGFTRRRSPGRHVIFERDDIFVNLQNHGGKIPPYQVRQLREKLSEES